MNDAKFEEPSFAKVEHAKQHFNYWARNNLSAKQMKEGSFILDTYTRELAEFAGKYALYVAHKGKS